jgi:diaminobutyrate-2-oxoglutarate transaminase
MGIFKRLESEVRGYCRSYDTVFDKAQGALLYDIDGRRHIDFLAGAGSLNYGHNHPALKKKLIEYLESDGIMHGLDMHTAAKKRLLQTMDEVLFWPREQDYKVQFPGPTGTNAVEAAFKLARNITGRSNIVSFTNGFHGVTMGSVAATGNTHFRDAVGVPLNNITFMPYDGYLGDDADTLKYFERFLEDSSSGVDLPAAVIVETVQGEGGVNVASAEWLRGLRQLCDKYEILMIVDDIQVGCGRTGSFFSFEEAGISPDIITLSKSLSGCGLPFSVVLIKSDYDQWEPGQHNGTFRGNSLAFVTAVEALNLFWRDNELTKQVRAKGKLMRDRLQRIADKTDAVKLQVRGRGMVQALACPDCPDLADAVSSAAWERQLIVETSGTDSNVLKLLPPLTIETELLEEGLDIIEASYEQVLNDSQFTREHQRSEAGQ